MADTLSCGRLMSLGIPKHIASDLIKDVKLWLRSSGPEWTVQRLKDIKSLYVNKLAGSPYEKPSWISLNKRGNPKGAWSFLFENSSRRNLSQVLTSLNAYSAIIAKRVSKKQERKFFSSMESMDKRGMSSTLKIIPRRRSQKPRPLPMFLEHCVNPGIRAPGPNGKSIPETESDLVFIHAAQSKPLRKIVFDYEDIFEKVLPMAYFANFESKSYDDAAFSNTVGTISGIQEPGFKLRAVANPSRILQAALEPLKLEVMNILRHTPNDYTHNQKDAVPVVQGWLKEGRTVHSVDLSDATNLFPRNVQFDLLERTLDPSFADYISLMRDVSVAPWGTKLRGSPEIVRFSRGQPLGLGPSFAVFAYTHNVLVEGICKKVGVESDYCIIGDDVVIANDEVARIYRKTLDNLGCQISESKSISSNKLAEFAGHVITSTKTGQAFKWRSVSDFSFYDLAKNLGPKCLGYLDPHQRYFCNLMRQVPKSLGGLGWSDGRSLAEAMDDPLIQKLIVRIIDKDSLEKLTVSRDSIPAVRSFLNKVAVTSGVRPGNSLSESSFGGRVQDLTLSHIWDHPRIAEFENSKEMWIRPHFVVSYVDSRPPGYYNIVPVTGDPRPNALHLLRYLGDPNLSRVISKFVTVASTNKMVKAKEQRRKNTVSKTVLPKARPNKSKTKDSPKRDRSKGPSR